MMPICSRIWSLPRSTTRSRMRMRKQASALQRRLAACSFLRGWASERDQKLMSDSLLEQLIEALRCLPGVGQKSAQRMAYHLLERDRDGARRLSERLAEAMEKVGHCARCRDF